MTEEDEAYYKPRFSRADLDAAERIADWHNARVMRGIVLMLALLIVVAFTALRVVPAWYQCAGFTHTAACFVHDVLTGEDL